MAMKVVKKTDEYTIFLRGDERYAIKDAKKQPVNGDDKVRILVAEGLLKVAVPAEPEPEVAEDAGEEAAAEEEAAPEEATAEEAAAEEAAAEETAEEAPAEEAAAEEEAPAEEAAEDESK